MKYLSIDIETSGLNPETCQILSMGIILEDTEKKLSKLEIPKLHIILLHDFIQGEPYALNLNKDIIGKMLNHQTMAKANARHLNKYNGVTFLDSENVVGYIKAWLVSKDFLVSRDVTKLNIAGKNFGTFDKLFIEKLPYWKSTFSINQRIIDPAVIFVDWIEDETLPNLSVCKARAGMDDVVSHDAIDDAWDVIELLRIKY
jgi:hypothetical protein